MRSLFILLWASLALAADSILRDELETTAGEAGDSQYLE